MATRARRRTRRNPIRTTGSLVINPRRRRRKTRRNALQIRTNRRNPSRRRRRRRNSLQIRRTNRRNPLQIRRANRRNPRRKRRMSAKHRAAISRGLKRRGRKRNPRRRSRRRAPRATYKRRRNTHRRRRKTTKRRRNAGGMASMLRKIPFIGPILASAIGLAPHTLFGAITVEPTMMAARFLGRYVPWMPAPLFYMVAGLLVGAIIKSKFIPLAASTKNQLAIAAAAAAGGVGYYKAGGIGGLLSMGSGETMADEVGALELRGYSGPLGLLEIGALELRGWGSPAPGYGEYGPTAVHRLGVR